MMLEAHSSKHSQSTIHNTDSWTVTLWCWKKEKVAEATSDSDDALGELTVTPNASPIQQDGTPRRKAASHPSGFSQLAATECHRLIAFQRP